MRKPVAMTTGVYNGDDYQMVICDDGSFWGYDGTWGELQPLPGTIRGVQRTPGYEPPKQEARDDG